MRRPAHQEKTLDRIRRWREICPELTIRSTFIVGFPGETDEDFDDLIDWLEAAQIDRAGCFKYEPVAGAPANEIANFVPDEVTDIRFERFMDAQARLSEARLARAVGQSLDVLIDEVSADGAIGRTKGDAPEIDGRVHIAGASNVAEGDIVKVRISKADDHDLFGAIA